MKIVCISDTHGLHDKVSLPKGDMIIHAGDCTNFGSKPQAIEFLDWFSELDYKYKIFIAGNHDFFFDLDEDLVYDLLDLYPGIIYLEDSAVTIEGVKIWGSPYTPTFFDWAFMRDRGEQIKDHWDQIPDDTYILITHGPPWGILDNISEGTEHLGCKDLFYAALGTAPKLHIFGHIHGGYGMKTLTHENIEKKITGRTTFINASICDEKYRPVNKPIVVNIITEYEQELIAQLRRETGMALMDCKRCLDDNGWDFAKALIDKDRYRWDGRLINEKLL